MASSLLASVLVTAGGAVGGPTGSATPWASTLGEPLHDSSHQALKLTQHLKAMGAKFYGAWTCPACFKQMNLFGKQAGADVIYVCLLYTSPSPRDGLLSRMPSSA